MRNSGPDSDNATGERSDNDRVGGESADDAVTRELAHNLIETWVVQQLNGETGYPDEDIDRVEVAIRTFQKSAGKQTFNSLIDVLNGGTGGMNGLYHDDDNFRQAKIDIEALQLLYGVMRNAGREPREAARLAYIGYWHYCNEDDDERNFVNYPEGYKLDRLRRAIDGFNWGEWYRWRRWEHKDGYDADEPDHWTNDYGDPLYNIILALVDIGCGELNPTGAAQWYEVDIPTDSDVITDKLTSASDREEPDGAPPILGKDGDEEYNEEYQSFPKMGPGGDPPSHRQMTRQSYVQMSDVVEAATKIDSRSKRSYENAIRSLRKDGRLTWAEIKKGEDYRIYPSYLSDPAKANLVKTNGEKYVPEQSKQEEVDGELLTDGGTQMSTAESHDKLGRIRQARGGSDNSTDTPDVYTCPIGGCSRTVVGNPGDLRNHVVQSMDSVHRHRTLTEDLEVEFDRQAYLATWGPGVRESDSSVVTVKSAAIAEW